MNILDFIPTGKENAVSKQELMLLTGINDHRANAIGKTTAKLKKHLYDMKNIRVTPVRQHYRRLSGGDVSGQISMEAYNV